MPRISDLPKAGPLTGDEQMVLVQDGVTKQVSQRQLSSLAGGIVLSGVRTAAPLGGGTTDNWSPDLSDVSRIRFDAGANGEITGIAGGQEGMFRIFTNVGAEDVILRSQSPGSLGPNRLALNGDMILPPGASILLVYDGSLSRWTMA